VYSLTVTLFALLMGGGLGSFASRRITGGGLQRRMVAVAAAVSVVAVVAALALPAIVSAAIVAPLPARITLAALLLLPVGFLMGMPLPGGIRIMSASRPELVPWAWAMNGALSVVGAVLAVFIAMNWGFSATLATGATLYLVAALVLGSAVPARERTGP